MKMKLALVALAICALPLLSGCSRSAAAFFTGAVVGAVVTDVAHHSHHPDVVIVDRHYGYHHGYHHTKVVHYDYHHGHKYHYHAPKKRVKPAAERSYKSSRGSNKSFR